MKKIIFLVSVLVLLYGCSNPVDIDNGTDVVGEVDDIVNEVSIGTETLDDELDTTEVDQALEDLDNTLQDW